jgi:hypothetical protein
MAKRGKEEYSAHEHELFALRWEFLRRNQKYIHDIKRCLASSRSLQRADPQERSDQREAWDMYFMGLYGVAFPLDPGVSFLESRVPLVNTPRHSKRRRAAGNRFVRRSSDVMDLSDLRVLFKGAYCLTPDRHVEAGAYGEVINSKPLTDEEIRQTKSIEVLIDLDVPTERILREVESIVSAWKRVRAGVVPARKTRARLAEYKRYLKVFDMRSGGASWERTAERLYPEDVEKGRVSYAKRKARRDYERCESMIAEGYRQLR